MAREIFARTTVADEEVMGVAGHSNRNTPTPLVFFVTAHSKGVIEAAFCNCAF